MGTKFVKKLSQYLDHYLVKNRITISGPLSVKKPSNIRTIIWDAKTCDVYCCILVQFFEVVEVFINLLKGKKLRIFKCQEPIQHPCYNLLNQSAELSEKFSWTYFCNWSLVSIFESSSVPYGSYKM